MDPLLRWSQRNSRCNNTKTKAPCQIYRISTADRVLLKKENEGLEVRNIRKSWIPCISSILPSKLRPRLFLNWKRISGTSRDKGLFYFELNYKYMHKLYCTCSLFIFLHVLYYNCTYIPLQMRQVSTTLRLTWFVAERTFISSVNNSIPCLMHCN